jgi:hypothetical protein
MSVQTPQHYIGRFLNAGGSGVCTLAGCTLSSISTLSPGTARNLLGSIETFEFNSENATEEISATPSRAQNEMILSTGTSLEASGIWQQGDSVAAPTVWANALAQNFDVLQFIVLIGQSQLGAAGITNTFYGVVKSLRTAVEGKGKVRWTLSLGPIDTGTANPAQV